MLSKWLSRAMRPKQERRDARQLKRGTTGLKILTLDWVYSAKSVSQTYSTVQINSYSCPYTSLLINGLRTGGLFKMSTSQRTHKTLQK